MARELTAGARHEALRAASRSLAQLLDSDPRAALLLEERALPSRVQYLDLCVTAAVEGGLPSLRRAKRARLMQIAAFDLCGEAPLEEVGRALSDLADGCLEATLVHLVAPTGLGVIAMGKLGGRELNYVSDIDVVFVAQGDLDAATRAAEDLLSGLGGVSAEGRAYVIDPNLRPQGRSGALVRSLEGFLEYYKRWAQPWEFQALLKARAAAGNQQLGKALVDRTRPLVFPSEVDAERVASIRKMKKRVEEHALKSLRRTRASETDDVKLGPGGIRDIEFAVQLLQLVHGGSNPSVTTASTLDALPVLADGGYIAEDDAAGLSVAYRWLRNVEHRLQLYQERRVHRLPLDPTERARVAHVMGFRDSPAQSALTRFENAHRSVLGDVRRRFERLFYRPMIESLADPGGGRLSEDALKDRLRVLGYLDVERAARTLGGLVAGSSRRSKLFRVLTPSLLRGLAQCPRPDAGLLSFLRLGEAMRDRLDALGSLRDNPAGLELLARVLGSGRVLGELLSQVPEEMHSIADPRGPAAPKDRERFVREATATLGWRAPEQRLDGLRRFKRREMLRVVLADLSGVADLDAVGRGLSDIADACLEAALEDSPFPFAVIGMGKLGGRELNYSSDIDVMFVHGGDPAAAERVAEGLIRAIAEVTPEGQTFRIDPNLRPEGRSGPLVRSVRSYLEYYERWSNPWEHQALIKARLSTGDTRLGDELIERTTALAYPRRLSPAAVAEARHLKARMERERIPRGTDARRHIKLGPGGMSDVEFTVQMLQRMHGHELEPMRTGNTLDALAAARAAGLLSEARAVPLRDAYVFLNRARNRLFFLTGRPVDALPVKPEDLEALGIAMGYEAQPRQELEEDYLRLTRRARKVAEAFIYG
jgi:[glutamine synthetase] adenylyltransferase / [glutamine synthetase]-adenylyl-L-tyrosine phosphorylase